MKISKSRLAAVLLAAGSVIAVGCNDTNSQCISACEHVQSCIPDGGSPTIGTTTNCSEGCASAADAGYGGCTTPGAAYDCISGLSCPDLLGTQSGPSEAFFVCLAKAGCDAGF